MKLLTAPTRLAAAALASKALAYATNQQAAAGTAWSPIYSDGTGYGIAWDESVLPAFTPEELGTQTSGEGLDAVTTHTQLIEADIVTRDEQGNTTGGTWDIAP